MVDGLPFSTQFPDRAASPNTVASGIGVESHVGVSSTASPV
jgi:hypothetical protein